MTGSILTLSKAMQEYMAATGKSIKQINHDVFDAPFGAEPFQGGENYLDLVARGIQGGDALVGPQYNEGSKHLSAFLIAERKRLGQFVPEAQPAPPRPMPAPILPQIRKRRPRKPAPKRELP